MKDTSHFFSVRNNTLIGRFRYVFISTWLLILSQNVQAMDSMGHIFGSSASEWQIWPSIGAVDGTHLEEREGNTVLTADVTNPTSVTSQKPVEADSEVSIRFRFEAANGNVTSLYVAAGLKNEGDVAQNPLLLQLTSPAGVDRESVNWALPALLNQTPGEDSGKYTVRYLPKNRLTWPEMVRSHMEENFGSTPSLSQRWLTVTYIFRKNSARIYLDGRLLRSLKSINPQGYIRVTFREETQLASIQIRKLPPENPIFETVQLDYDLNASSINGKQIQHDIDQKSDEKLALKDRVLLQGVPFEIPSPDKRENDHIDVGRSWMPFGLLLDAGYAGGDTPRWAGALNRELNRICFRVPSGPYSKIHLLAAFDGEKDKIPEITVQFYRDGAGHPVNFSSQVPLFMDKVSGDSSLPVQLKNGDKGNLYLITIPLEPNGLISFSDMGHIEFELTKKTHVYRCYPDPLSFSQHGAGLPSGVHVYGVTLERPAIEVSLQPDQFANIWTAPEKPSYTIQLQNDTPKKQEVHIEVSTNSYDGMDKTLQQKSVQLAPNDRQSIKIPLELKQYGYHDVRLKIQDADGIHTQTSSLAYLHPDTRERGGWEEGKGPLWGFWDWEGAHLTPNGVPRLEVMVKAGAESVNRPLVEKKKDIYGGFSAEELAYAEAHGMITHFLVERTALGKDELGVEFDPTKPAEMKEACIKAWQKLTTATPTKLNKPEIAIFWAEPLLGPVSYMSFPEYYGDPAYQMTKTEQANYEKFRDEFVIAGSAIKETWPNAKCLMPWGIPSFPIPFLRNSKEATKLMDGPAIDLILFHRLPEMQMHQVTFASTMWQLKQEWLKTGKQWPSLTTMEGGGLTWPATPGALTLAEESDHMIRGELILSAYGVNRHLGNPIPFRCEDFWGETNYGDGLIERIPLLSPKPAYSAYATMTRQLNRMNYVKSIETGSATVFCLQFKHYKTGELLHVFWTVRGKRVVTVTAPTSDVQMYDSMDNVTNLKDKNGNVTFTIDTSPCYVHGLSADPKITLGEADHSDAKPAKFIQLVSNLGNGWNVSEGQDKDYEDSHAVFIKRFPGKMSVRSVSAPSVVGGKGLSIHLDKPEKERKVMPFYTTLVPPKPIVIAGKPGYLGLWVHAASDWGRIIYCLRDAKGEKWLSVGKKDEWNVDDLSCQSSFNFDGWRYLRFDLPGNQPWDCYRDAESTSWGNYGSGDGIVDLPLTLEKIIIERRTHVIKVDELISANPEDVILGDLYAEYKSPEDETEEAVRLSRLRMPESKESPAIENPIQKIAQTGTGEPITITKIEPPNRNYDGTQCLVFFEPVVGAKSYDVWVSTYADGRGAIKLGENWTEPGKLLEGLPANTELFLFVSYADTNGKISKPSAAKRILLKDDFPFK